MKFNIKSAAFIFCILVVLLPFPGQAQTPLTTKARQYISSLLNDTSDVTKPQFLFYPALSYAPETSWELGISGLYVFYPNRDTTNRLNEVKAYTFYTLEKQYGLLLNHSLFSDQNKWMALGRLRFQYFPLLYYGIGPDSDADYLARVNALQIHLRERILRRVATNFYLGLATEYQRLSSVEFVPATNQTNFVLPAGASGSANLGFGLSAVYDARRNMLNVRQGAYSELTFVRYSKTLSSDFAFTNVVSDNRIYKAINRRDVLALQVLGQFNFGEVPFNQLSLMGGENIMRGYYLGRYRDNNLVATQAEYRFLPLPLGFTNRWGAAIFAGAGSVFNKPDKVNAKDFVWSAGGGLRFLVFPKKDVFSRLDVAFTQEGPGFYIFIGEAF